MTHKPCKHDIITNPKGVEISRARGYNLMGFRRPNFVTTRKKLGGNQAIGNEDYVKLQLVRNDYIFPRYATIIR